MQFTHLHTHSHYSILDGVATVKDLVQNAKAKGMKSLALTDHGNLFGAFEFFNECKKNDIKPIIGCEFYLCDNMYDRQDRTRYHQILLAKNYTGYQNLLKLSSLSFRDGFYYKSRIDKKILFQHSEGLIATSCCMQGEIPQAILKKDKPTAEKLLKEWIKAFGDDYYIEIQKRETLRQLDVINPVLLEFAKKYNIETIATNDVHYCEKDDAKSQDLLICLQTGKNYHDPSRMKFDDDTYFLKTPDEMLGEFGDYPQSIDNTQKIVDKVETLDLNQEILMPNFEIPNEFSNQADYLTHLSFEGLKKKHGEVLPEYSERLETELKVINGMNFPGYFLVVSDLINAAKELGVTVGPGRGSAAGSLVAYATGITGIDPIKYDLIFERFLNPERISMPDIDIDFDDVGRQKVMDYVCQKFGHEKVSQIITFGYMKAKSSIKDVARVLDLPISEANRLAKMLDDYKGETLKNAVKEIPKLKAEMEEGNPLVKETLHYACKLEGTIRQTGVHAAGVIIAPEPISNIVPLSNAKESSMMVTQFDGKYVEDAGMLKMDFLGLKTLNIIKIAIENIKKTKGIDIDLETIPLDDPKAFEVFQAGNTIGIFQFESPGMRKHLKELKPNDIEGIIAMNALYRPGPMQFIDTYIKRSHGEEEVQYPHPMLEPILKKTFGIMVYQEQIQQSARIMANYTLGAADILRRAMGKKKPEEMKKQRKIFIKGAQQNSIKEKEANKVFDIMAKFAEYGFNRSHSAAYSVLAFQSAYLKGNYPTEFLASLLSNNTNDIKELTKLLEECKSQGVTVNPPDINQSLTTFTPTTDGNIIFGLSAIKGLGEESINKIIEEREANGKFLSLTDFLKRLDTKSINKKVLESMVYSGALDVFKYEREQYFALNENNETGIEIILKYLNYFKKQKDSSQLSLFGGGGKDDGMEETIQLPKIEAYQKWDLVTTLNHEKDVTGIYLSGHPLEPFKETLRRLTGLKDLQEISKTKISGTVGGMIQEVKIRQSKNGKEYASFELIDFTGSFPFWIFGDDFIQNQNFIKEGNRVCLDFITAEDYRDKSQVRVIPKKIYSLENGMKEKVKGIILKIDLSEIQKENVTLLAKIVKENQNMSEETPHRMRITLTTTEDGESKSYNLISSERVNVDDTFLNELEILSFKYSIF